ncbi:MAG: glycosyltransferase family 4 protein [Chloroflexi bacterium]|nr:glycosyltransferase family 4 protein [Chloroflexota bacterium]
MRVLMVAERLPPAIGGVERHVAGLARQLHHAGVEVTLVAPAHLPGLPAEDDLDGVRLLRTPYATRKRAAYRLAWRWWLARRSLLDWADVLHFHEVYAMLHLSLPALLFPGPRRYLTYHGYEMRYPIPLRARLYRRLAARQARGYLCVGAYLARWFGLRPQEVTYGAVDLPPSPAAPLPAAPAALFLGRLDADTGAEACLQATAILQRAHDLPLPLTLCGDGPARPALEALARRESLDARFTGFLADPAPYIDAASMVFTPGYLAMLESFARRRPVFAVYAGPVKADYFRLFPQAERTLSLAGSAQELAGQLARYLLYPKERSAAIEAAYQVAAAHTWQKLADRYLRLWGSA